MYNTSPTAFCSRVRERYRLAFEQTTIVYPVCFDRNRTGYHGVSQLGVRVPLGVYETIARGTQKKKGRCRKTRDSISRVLSFVQTFILSRFYRFKHCRYDIRHENKTGCL